jgi:chemotaxis protein histidine kinase CheA
MSYDEQRHVKVTPGMANSMGKGGPARVCPECGLSVPRYVGRYPSKCPECSAVLEPVEESISVDEQIARVMAGESAATVVEDFADVVSGVVDKLKGKAASDKEHYKGKVKDAASGLKARWDAGKAKRADKRADKAETRTKERLATTQKKLISQQARAKELAADKSPAGKKRAIDAKVAIDKTKKTLAKMKKAAGEQKKAQSAQKSAATKAAKKPAAKKPPKKESMMRESLRVADDRVVGEVMLTFPGITSRSALAQLATEYGSDYYPEFFDGGVLWSFASEMAARRFYIGLTKERGFGDARLVINGAEVAQVGHKKWGGPLLPKTESVTESQHTPLDHQLGVIRRVLDEGIREQGYAKFDRLQQRLRCNPVALRNVISEHAPAWGMIVVDNDRVYPRRANNASLKG